MNNIPGYLHLSVGVRVDPGSPSPESPIALHTNGVRLNGCDPAHPDVFAWMTVAEAEKLIVELKAAIRKARAKST